MATSDQDLSETLQSGSDSPYDSFCEPCDTEGQHLEAVSYCRNCNVHLCLRCVKDHRRNPASRLHQVLEAAVIPMTSGRPKTKDVLTQPCQKHEDKILEYYCSRDDALCCHVCLNIDHASCTRAYIPDVSSGIANCQEFQDVKTDLDRLTLLGTDEEIIIDLNEKDNDTFRSSAISDIKSNREEIDKLLDEAENQAIKRVDELHSLNAAKIQSASQSCQSVLSDAKTMAADLKENASAGKNNQLFVGVKMAASRLPAMKEDMNQIQAQKMSRYIFDKDNGVQEFKSALPALFPVTVRQVNVNVSARFMGVINVKAEDDSKNCDINGIAALSGDRLVVTDWDNKAVKLVDVKLNNVISRLALSSVPYDVISTKPDQVAVTLGKEQKIEIFTATNILTRNHTINVPGHGCSSLCYDGERFIVVYEHNQSRAVKMVDVSGSIVSTIYTDSDSDPLFKKPRYITLGRTHDVVYITDWKDNTVTCMTLRGRVIWVCRHAECPMGVSVCRDGEVIVCCRNTNTVQLVSRSGQLLQVLLDQQQGLAPFPRAICVFGDNIWVSSGSIKREHCNNITRFRLK